MVKIGIIGAGINGLSCAVKIKEKYKDLDVVLIASNFSPNTTGDGSGGLWYPYLCGDTPEYLLTKWGGETYKYLHELWLKGGHNICLMPIFNLYRDKDNFSRPNWSNIVFGYQEFQQKELEYFSKLYSAEYRAGQTFTTFVVPPSELLAHFSQRYKILNGKTVRADVKSLEDPVLNGFHVVINCTGVGAKYIVPDDKVFPIRGQVTRVIAPWMNVTVIDEDSGNYIIPSVKTCVLGGTHQEHNYNLKVDDKDTEFILNGCQDMVPALKHAEIISHWAGLRPGRHALRLGPEEKGGKLFIHNYGHGGSGFTLFWGCATDVLQILESFLNNNKIIECKL